MDLPEERVDIVEACVRWLYLGDHKLRETDDSSCTKKEVLEDRLSLYFLADKYKISILKGKYMVECWCFM